MALACILDGLPDEAPFTASAQAASSFVQIKRWPSGADATRGLVEAGKRPFTDESDEECGRDK